MIAVNIPPPAHFPKSSSEALHMFLIRVFAPGSAQELESHPKAGASWEGIALEQMLAHAGAGEARFWARLSNVAMPR